MDKQNSKFTFAFGCWGVVGIPCYSKLGNYRINRQTLLIDARTDASFDRFKHVYPRAAIKIRDFQT